MVRLNIVVVSKNIRLQKNNVLRNLQTTITLYALQNISSNNYTNNNKNYRV